MGQSAYARLEEDNFLIGKNKHNIIRLVAVDENTHDENNSEVLLYNSLLLNTDSIKLNCI